jgi:hypothetical protein
VADSRAVKILLNHYWSGGRWRATPGGETSDADLAYAVEHQTLFKPVALTHDEVWARLLNARDALSLRQVADAFVSSLSTRRLELRSALGSFAVFRRAKAHRPEPQEDKCGVCGLYLTEDSEMRDLSVLNFERFKWGGVRHDQPEYATFDLEWFSREAAVPVQPADVERLRLLIAALKVVPGKETSSSLQKRFAAVLDSNKAERDRVVAILGFCGVLENAERPGYRRRFIPFAERGLPSRHFVDMPYPACWWRGSDGVNLEAVKETFGHLL